MADNPISVPMVALNIVDDKLRPGPFDPGIGCCTQPDHAPAFLCCAYILS